MQPPNPFELYRDGQCIFITRTAYEWFLSSAVTRKRVATDDPVYGYRVHEVEQSLIRGPDIEEMGVADIPDRIANAGMTNLLAYAASEAGKDFPDSRFAAVLTLPPPCQEPHLTYPPLTRMMHDSERGLIRIGNSGDATQISVDIVADAVAAYPGCRIIVVGNTRPLQQLKRSLLQLPNERFPLAHRNIDVVSSRRPLSIADDEDFPNLLLSTPCGAADLDSEKCHIAILLDAMQCTQRQMQNMLIQVDAGFRLFGILSVNRPLKPYEKFSLHQVFGPAVIDVISQGRVRRPVQYAVVRQSGVAPPNSTVPGSQFHGKGQRSTVQSLAAYTYHHARNDTIARLARNLRSGEALSNKKYRRLRRWLQDHNVALPNVTIVVDRLDHAIELGKRLPDCPIFAGRKNDLDGVAARMRRRIISDPAQWHPERQQIVVADAAGKFAGGHSDVVIWASGGTTTSGVPASWMFSHSEPDRPMVIVDFLDEFSPSTRNWSFCRFEFLKSRDIFPVGTSDQIERTRRMLRGRGARR
ncbi:MAG: hypothetical protein R3C49_26245 [Planctomycetaceae bacterium]